MANEIRVTVWGEFRHEKTHEAVRKVYPKGMHTVDRQGPERRRGPQGEDRPRWTSRSMA